MSRTHRKTLQNRLNNRPISSNLTVFHSKHLFLSIEKAERLNARLILFLPFKSTFMPKYSLEKNNTNSNLSSGFVLFPNGGEEGIRTLVRFRANWFRVLWVNGCLVIFEGCFGKFYIHQKCLIWKDFWAVAPLKSRKIKKSSNNGIFTVFGKNRHYFGKNCGKNRINTSTTAIHRKAHTD